MPTKKAIIICAVVSALLIGASVWGWSSWSTGSAIDALEADNPTDAQIELIAGLLGDQSGKYRGRAVDKLRELGTRAVPALTNLSQSGEPKTRLTAAKLSAEIDPEGRGFEGFDYVLHDDDVVVRRGAAKILYYFIRGGKMADYPRPYELLFTAVDDPDANVRERIVDGLGHMHTKEATKALQKLAQDQDRDVAYAANRRLELTKRGDPAPKDHR